MYYTGEKIGTSIQILFPQEKLKGTERGGMYNTGRGNKKVNWRIAKKLPKSPVGHVKMWGGGGGGGSRGAKDRSPYGALHGTRLSGLNLTKRALLLRSGGGKNIYVGEGTPHNHLYQQKAVPKTGEGMWGAGIPKHATTTRAEVWGETLL